MTNNTEIKINVADEMCLQYPAQSAPQPCRIELDCDNAIFRAKPNHEIGNGVPSQIYHKRWQYWTIPCLQPCVAQALLEDLLPLAERVIAGYELVFDGHNHVGKYSEDAKGAIDEISAELENHYFSEHDLVRVEEAEDYFSGVARKDNAKDLGICARTTDSELEGINDKLETELCSHDVYIVGLRSYLFDLRDDLLPK